MFKPVIDKCEKVKVTVYRKQTLNDIFCIYFLTECVQHDGIQAILQHPPLRLNELCFSDVPYPLALEDKSESVTVMPVGMRIPVSPDLKRNETG